MLWIDPHRIKYKLSEKTGTLPIPPTHIVSGDWDLDLEPLENDVVFESFYQHFVESRPWRETDYVDFLGESISEHGGISAEEALVRCREMDRLFDYIDTYGYLCQDELERRGELLVGLSNSLLPPVYREIAVNITRDGGFVWHAGMHRLVIAQILDIETIPVRIHIRHSQWQETRESVYTKRELRGHVDHPDLEYLI